MEAVSEIYWLLECTNKQLPLQMSSSCLLQISQPPAEEEENEEGDEGEEFFQLKSEPFL